MDKNWKVETILSHMPDFKEVNSLFHEHYFGFQKLGVANNASLLHGTGWNSPTNEIVCFFLIGFATGQIFHLIEEDNAPDFTNISIVWKLIEDQLGILLPELEKEWAK